MGQKKLLKQQSSIRSDLIYTSNNVSRKALLYDAEQLNLEKSLRSVTKKRARVAKIAAATIYRAGSNTVNKLRSFASGGFISVLLFALLILVLQSVVSGEEISFSSEEIFNSFATVEAVPTFNYDFTVYFHTPEYVDSGISGIDVFVTFFDSIVGVVSFLFQALTYIFNVVFWLFRTISHILFSMT